MQNRTILITGSSRGLGLALARHWAAENTVIGISRSPAADLESGVRHYACDLADAQQIAATMQRITADFPVIDLAVNNAAVLTSVPLGIMSTDDIGRMVDVNLKAPMLISKAVLRRMMRARSGQIVNILSMATKVSVVGDSVYAATKAGLEAFSKVLNREGHSFGVHVNNVAVSAFASEMLEQVTGGELDKVLDLIPHRQLAPLEEIIAAIEFFADNPVDIGGQTLFFGGV